MCVRVGAESVKGAGVEVEYIVGDAERAADPALYTEIVSRVKAIVGTDALRVLINNVGIEVLET